MSTYRLIVDVDPHGERWAMLLHEDGIPAFYPNLFNTCKLRNRRLSTSTQEQFLTAIKILNETCDAQKINLIDRIKRQRFLTTGEVDAISDACRTKRRGVKKSNVLSLKKGYTKPKLKVADSTHYLYLSRIADYIKWLSEKLLDTHGLTLEASNQINSLVKAIRSRAMRSASRNLDDEALKGISNTQEEKLFEVLRPGSTTNPFRDPGIQLRNYLLVKLLRVTGTRRGEVLNLRVSDIDWEKSQISIIRRADTPQDPRSRQPVVKTNQRILPVKREFLDEILAYIVQVRKRIPNSHAHPYLLISHKSGPSEGLPLSLSSIQEIFSTLRQAHPELNLTAHDLRHRWNEKYSEAMHAQKKISHIEAEELRNYLEGWSPESQMGKRYNRKWIREKAHEAMIKTQEDKELSLQALRTINSSPDHG